MFALVPKKLAAKGAHLRYGYNHCESGRWLGPDQQVTEEDHLIWMGANDITNLLARAPQGFQRANGGSTIKFSVSTLDAKDYLEA
ncbi:hypothetical protein [uncultured Roseovarius sp.]|uniref:hypothetical protein n=1 Tax=uncultured Roseovarius sp. TaxID=293344 RepID=UPI00260B7FF8|nr:hypothetical protein [uncultured Roseovarius sp.]